jgi:hypothetical protein
LALYILLVSCEVLTHQNTAFGRLATFFPPVLASGAGLSVRAIPSRVSQTRIFVPLRYYFEFGLKKFAWLDIGSSVVFSMFDSFDVNDPFFLHLGGGMSFAIVNRVIR